jgi:hypothetical protein
MLEEEEKDKEMKRQRLERGGVWFGEGARERGVGGVNFEHELKRRQNKEGAGSEKIGRDLRDLIFFSRGG